jgi:hypothetical protein
MKSNWESPFSKTRAFLFLLLIMPIMSQLCLIIVLAIGLWKTYLTSAQIVPFVNCTINDGSTCITVWGYTNSYPNTLVLPLFRNRFTPAPVFRGQLTVFQSSTTVSREFDTSRLCNTGNLTWSLTDPFTNQINSAVCTNQSRNNCNSPIAIQVNCTNNPRISDILLQCQQEYGSQCPFCGQVFSFCNDRGRLFANFRLDSCKVIGLGFSQVSKGCNYQQVLDNCCNNVGPPISPPLEPPITPPVEPAVCNPNIGLFYNVVNCIQNVIVPSN